MTGLRWKNVKSQSMATAKYKFQRLDFNLSNQKLIDFLDKLSNLPKNAFGVAAQAIGEHFMYAKMAPQLNKLNSQSHFRFREWLIRTDCVTSKRAVKNEWFGSSRGAANKYCDITSHTTKSRISLTYISPLQKTRSLPTSVPSIQPGKWLSPKQHK